MKSIVERCRQRETVCRANQLPSSHFDIYAYWLTAIVHVQIADVIIRGETRRRNRAQLIVYWYRSSVPNDCRRRRKVLRTCIHLAADLFVRANIVRKTRYTGVS